MKRLIYLRFFEFTYFLLNLCIRLHWWWMAKTLIDFRKTNIVGALRKMRATL